MFGSQAVLVITETIPDTPVIRGYDFNQGRDLDGIMESLFTTGFQARELQRGVFRANTPRASDVGQAQAVCVGGGEAGGTAGIGDCHGCAGIAQKLFVPPIAHAIVPWLHDRSLAAPAQATTLGQAVNEVNRMVRARAMHVRACMLHMPLRTPGSRGGGVLQPATAVEKAPPRPRPSPSHPSPPPSDPPRSPPPHHLPPTRCPPRSPFPLGCCRPQISWRLSDEPLVGPSADPDHEEPEFRENTRAMIFLGFTSNLTSSGVREHIR